TYLGGERAVPHYNVMGVGKAALDASVRYLAWDLGQKNIRVNAISAGPIRTLAARSIAGFPTMEAIVEERAPLHRQIDAGDVGADVARADQGGCGGEAGDDQADVKPASVGRVLERARRVEDVDERDAGEGDDGRRARNSVADGLADVEVTGHVISFVRGAL